MPWENGAVILVHANKNSGPEKGWGRGGGGYSLEWTTPGRGTFLRPQVYSTVGILHAAQVYEKVEKSEVE